MTQSIYIDPEEEITSILGRVKKMQADRCILVVPNSALILGSFINMKLLARESERIGKEIIVVTQDEVGLASVEKAGLSGGRSVEEFMPQDEVQEVAQEFVQPAVQEEVIVEELRQSAVPGSVRIENSQQLPGEVMESVLERSQPSRRIKNARVVDSMSIHNRRPRSMSGVISVPPSQTRSAQDLSRQVEQQETPHSDDMGVVYENMPDDDMRIQGGQTTLGRENLTRPLHQEVFDSNLQSQQSPAALEKEQFLQGHAGQPTQSQNVLPSYVGGQQRSVVDTPQTAPSESLGSPTDSYQELDQASYLDQMESGSQKQAPIERTSFTPDMQSTPVLSTDLQQSMIDSKVFRSREEKDPKMKSSLFSHKKESSKDTKNKNVVSSKKIKLAITAFVVLSVIIIGGVFAYVFYPEANISAYPQRITHKVEYDFVADTSVSSIDTVNKKLALVIQDEEKEIKQEFVSNGKGELGSQKSTGKVVISNAYSKDSQGLVATTRLETTDGKLYRLVESVVVPGTTKNDDGDLVPGEVEATVKADLPGEEFNTTPTTFTIPGFAGSDKFEKFSARNEVAFVGGASGESEYVFVSQQDVDAAQEILKEEVMKETIAALGSSISADEELLRQLVSVEVLETSNLPSVNTVSKNFTASMKVRVKKAEFSQTLLEEFLLRKLLEELEVMSGITAWDKEQIQITYGKIYPDLEKNSVRLRVEMQGDFTSIVNVDVLKQGMLGKDIEAFSATIEQYPELEKVDIEFSPGIFSQRIPRFENRVHIEVK